jgi:hypothetical protein
VPLPLANPPSQEECPEEDPIRTYLTGVFDLPASLRLWHLASIDAPTVAVVWALSFAWTMNIQLPGWVTLLLALGTWAVYVGDRLLDARAGFRTGDLRRLRERHYFHWRHRSILLPLAAAASCVVIALIFQAMPLASRNRNSFLAAAALAYFSGVHSRHRLPGWLYRLSSKEFAVGILFTAGCALPTFSRVGLIPNAAASRWPLVVVATLFAALAWLNCHAIEQWESDTPRGISIAAGALGLAGLALVWFLAPILFRASVLLAAGTSSALLIALLDWKRARLTPLTLRILADVALLTPIVVVGFGMRAR